MEGAPKQFQTPEEEIAYLRDRIAEREREVLDRSAEAGTEDLQTVAKQELFDYGTFTPDVVLSQEQQLPKQEIADSVHHLETAVNKIDEIMQIAQEKGIHNALSVLEKLDDAHLVDDVHSSMIEYIKSGKQVQNLKEGVPPWQILHTTLFEVTLPELREKDDREQSVKELASIMQQFYAGMQSVGGSANTSHVTLEIAVEEGSDDIIFYVAVPTQYIDLFEKQLLSLYPHAIVTERAHDYNIFVTDGVSLASTMTLARHPLYPLRLSETFDSDPLSVLLNAFSKIERDGGGAALQIMMRSPKYRYTDSYHEVLTNVRDGMRVNEAISRSTMGGVLIESAKELIFGEKKKRKNEYGMETSDADAVEVFNQKVAHPIVEVVGRIVVSATTQAQASAMLSDTEASFNQFENTLGNRIRFKKATGAALKKELKAYSFREFTKSHLLPLSLEELSLIMHFPANGVTSSPQFKQSRAKTAAAPTEMPAEGTLLGVNDHRNVQKDIYITAEDRLRHFYIIGQTGTGKTTLMKNMIVQDIQAGAGVCMIDPHGTDIEDVLGAVPPERADDVIYFDPSRQDRVVGLNMLEFDPAKPEQKTFVVNELFSIFQKLYGGNPESMGPMFEQYFRNATMLVLEDPDSGSTLMDISRVMADARYRRMKLERATNPVVVQFWKEIAVKAGGEAALENIVPYITSKFDVFTANDYMRPIIGQQESAFNFREVMDSRKILLVNLSKGRLGEINANLIGMIFVGKLLMAALSRVDDPSKSFAPFYLHMDEFQNVSTNSISAILSEARKYKMGLTIAHQFIAQLDEDIKDSVFGNVGSMAAFRVGPDDAQFLENQYQPEFDANDLMNVPNRSAFMRVLANGTPTKPFSLNTLAPQEPDLQRVTEMIELSYSKYGKDRAEVEAAISARYQPQEPAP